MLKSHTTAGMRMTRGRFMMVASTFVLAAITIGLSRKDDTRLPAPEPVKSSPRKTALKVKVGDGNSPQTSSRPASGMLVSTAGKKVLLNIYADGTFQLALPEHSNEIFVPKGENLLDHPAGLPRGVKIKIRNGAGEIVTASGGRGMQTLYDGEGSGWYRPGTGSIEMPVFSKRVVIAGVVHQVPVPSESRPTERPAPDRRISQRTRLSAMIEGLSRNFRNQSGLEFKLSIIPAGLNAYDSAGKRLGAPDFPMAETGWLNGDLLFEDE